MQLDKEFLVKRRFWILTGVFVPLMLVAMLWVTFSVSGAIEEKQKKIDTEFKELQRYASPNS